MLLFIMDDSVVVAIYVHSAVSTAIWVGLGSLQNSKRRPDGLCDASCVTASRVPSPTQMAIDTTEWPYIAATTETPIVLASVYIS